MRTFQFNIVIASLLLMAGTVYAQAQSSGQDERRAVVVDNEIYDQVVDILFPRKVLVGAFGYAFVIRFQPPFDNAESQITILNEARKIQVIEYRSLDGSIRRKLDKIYEHTNRQDVAEMAKQIRVDARVVNMPPAEVARLRQSFYDYLCRSAIYEKKQISENMQEWEVTEDATAYLLWYRGVEESFYVLPGSGLDTPPLENEHPLVSWMRDVRRTIKKSQATSNHKP